MSNQAILQSLRNIVGKEFATDVYEERSCHSYDASKQTGLPDYVVSPGSTQEISKIMKLATSKLIPVYPRGAASGLTGGSVPTRGGIALSLLRLNRILEIDDRDLIAVVEPGVVTAALQKEAAKQGLFYPPDPASYKFCTIGGNVAESAGGLRGLKYGVTKDYVLGLEVVLPNGEILNFGVRTLKGVVGYDLTRLFVGSEGTLGIVTRVTLKLIPLPEAKETMEVYFPTIQDAAATVSRIIGEKIIPTTLEFMDKETIDCVSGFLKKDYPDELAAILLIEIDGDPDVLDKQLNKVKKICLANNSIQINMARNDREREALWAGRRAISPAIYTLGGAKINEDICVPRSKLPAMLDRIDQISREHNLTIVNFGHAGDGNIHVNLILPHNFTDTDKQNGLAAIEKIFDATLELGGTISGEHGIWLSKAAYLGKEIGAREIKLMKQVKRLFDPHNIMNPGKIF